MRIKQVYCGRKAEKGPNLKSIDLATRSLDIDKYRDYLN